MIVSWYHEHCSYYSTIASTLKSPLRTPPFQEWIKRNLMTKIQNRNPLWKGLKFRVLELVIHLCPFPLVIVQLWVMKKWTLSLFPLHLDLEVWHGKTLVNQKPLVSDHRKQLEIKHHLADNPQVGSLSSGVTVQPVRWRLWNIRQNLNKTIHINEKCISQQFTFFRKGRRPFLDLTS